MLGLLPKPSNRLRALYLGDTRPEALPHDVFRFALYADEILVINPFHNPWFIRPKFNPINNPGQYKSDTIKIVLFALLLEGWVREGLVTLIPDPNFYDWELSKKTQALAEKGFKEMPPTEEEIAEIAEISRAEMTRFFTTLPVHYLEQTVRQTLPEISDKKRQEILTGIREFRRGDPLAVDQPVEQMGNQLQLYRQGTSLEGGLVLSHITGAFPYTNVRYIWRRLLWKQSLGEAGKLWSPLTKAFQELEFKFLDKVDSGFGLRIRRDGRLESFRGLLRRIWKELCTGEPDEKRINSLSRDFRDELRDEYAKAEADWAAIDRDLLKAVGKTGGSGALLGSLVTGGLDITIPAAGFVIGSVLELVQARMKRKEFRKRVPMSVFVDLSRKYPRT